MGQYKDTRKSSISMQLMGQTLYSGEKPNVTCGNRTFAWLPEYGASIMHSHTSGN